MPRGREAIRIPVEACIRIDLAEPAVRAALTLGVVRFGTWRWTRFGEQVAELAYEWRGDTPALRLRYSVGGVAMVEDIDLVITTLRFGGQRLWFLCPATGRRVRALYLPPGGRRFLSRQAYQLVYQSTRESGLGRAILRILARGERDPVRARHWRTLASKGGDPLGFLDDRRHAVREEGRRRRNAVRRIRRGERRREGLG